MTRLERAAEKVRKTKEKREALEQKQKEDLEKQREDERQAEAVYRLEEGKRLTRRRYAVGDLAERAGFLHWSDAELTRLFALLARLAPYPDPVAVLEGLLGTPAAAGGLSFAAPLAQTAANRGDGEPDLSPWSVSESEEQPPALLGVSH
jgi:hypothetical protein